MKDQDQRPAAPSLHARARVLARADRAAPSWRRRVETLLHEVAVVGTAADAAACAAWLDDPDQALARLAAVAIIYGLGRSGPMDLARLDGAIRGPMWGGADPLRLDWSGDQPGRLDPWRGHAATSPGDVTRLGLSSMHHDGFVRELAVERLAGVGDGSELAYLLLRRNDWVGPVRAAAATALAARLRPNYAPHFVRVLPLIDRLAAGGRDDHGPFVAAVQTLLQAPAARPELLAGVRSRDPLVARGCFWLALAAPDLDLADLLAAVADHPDHSIRLAAIRAGRARLATADFVVRAPTWLGDRFAPVRREALLGLVERAPERAEVALRTALLDPHRSIREVARFYLLRLIPFDAAKFYWDQLRPTTGATLPWALAGLGETGRPADVDLVRPFLPDLNLRVRREAVRALGRLAGPAHVPALLAALADPHPGVSRVAAEALARHAGLVSPSVLVGLIWGNAGPHVGRRALGLLARVGKWPPLPHLIRATHAADSALASKATTLLAAWIANFNRSPVRPSPADIDAARAALDAASLPAETARAVRFLLKGW